MTDSRDVYKAMNAYPFRQMAELVEKYAESTGLMPVPQFFIVDRFTLADGTEHPVTPHPFRYTAAKVLEDWLASPGAGISFVMRIHDPADPADMEAYERHKAAAANELSQSERKA